MSITRVASQGGGVTNNNAATVSRAYPGNVTSGNIVIVACGKYDPGSTVFLAGAVAKSAGTATLGAFALHAQDQNSGDTPHNVGVWSAIVTGTGSLTLTVTGSSGSYWVLATDELTATTGFDASRAEATANTNPNGGATSTTQISDDMTSAANAAFFGMVELSTGVNVTDLTEDAAFTRVYRETDGTSGTVGTGMIRIVSSGTTDRIESTTSSSGAQLFIAVGVVLKEIGGGGGSVLGSNYYRQVAGM
jgi:hypothetical protein